MSQKMAVVLFSGTADKLQAAATMVSGAAAMGVETHVFLTFWGLNAFRKDMAGQPLPMSADYGAEGEMVAKLMHEKQVPSWFDVMQMAADVGDVTVHACAMTMDLLDIEQDDLVDMVEDVIGVATFVGLTEGANVLFI